MTTTHWVAILLLGMTSLSARAARPASEGNPQNGKALVQKSCDACHASLHGGDPTRVYSPPARKVRSFAQLVGQVHAFATNTNAGWSAEDERDAAAYLNENYYRFK
jgi:mono/diheme cytochrome c family protein